MAGSAYGAVVIVIAQRLGKRKLHASIKSPHPRRADTKVKGSRGAWRATTRAPTSALAPIRASRLRRILLEATVTHRSPHAALIVVPIRAVRMQTPSFARRLGKPVLVLLTKADKLTRQRAAAQLQAVRKTLDRCEVILFSSVSGMGVDEAQQFVEALLAA